MTLKEALEYIQGMLRDGAGPVLAYNDGVYQVSLFFMPKYDSEGPTLESAIIAFAERAKQIESEAT
jgi:hypothetical protein